MVNLIQSVLRQVNTIKYFERLTQHGFSFADMVEISLAGADATWQGDDERRQLRERIREEGTKLQRALDARTTKGTPEGAPFDTPPPDR